MDDVKGTNISIISTLVYEVLRSRNYSPKLLNYLTLITMGMVKVYGEDYLKEILETISTPIYHFDYDENELKNTNIKITKKFLNNNKCFVIFSVADFNDEMKVDYDFYVTDNEISSSFILEFLTRELNNILMNKNNLVSKKRRKKIIKNSSLEDSESSKVFNGIINLLQTENIIKEVIKLTNNDIDINLRNLIVSLINEISFDYHINGLENEVNIFRKVYEDSKYMKVINNSVISGNMNKINKLFNDVLGNDAYERIITNLNEFTKLFKKSRTKNNSYIYDASLKYCSLREDFKRFINNI